MQSAKMIYPDKKLADAILGSLCRSVATVTLPYGNHRRISSSASTAARRFGVGKTTLFGFDVDYASNTVAIQMPVEYAKKRRFI